MIRIFKTCLSSSSDSPEGLTTELGQQTSPGRRGFGPKSSGHRSPGGGASILANKRLTLPFLALVAVLAAGLLFLLPGGLLQAQEAMTELDYAENGTDPVATFTGLDPEGRTVYWSLLLSDTSVTIFPIDPAGINIIAADAADDSDLSISMDGVLTFNFPPDYEMNRNDDNSVDSADRTYKVVVVSSDNAPGAQTTAMPIMMAYHKVTVMVTDVDEDGTVSLSALQPQVDVPLNTAGTTDNSGDDAAATLKDQDASMAQINAAKWKWEQSSAMDGSWTPISGATTASYNPARDVAGMYLRLTATYTDKHGEGKTAMATSAQVVRAKPAGSNTMPVVPDEDLDGDRTDNLARSINENSPPGTNVGKPVTFGDAGDILTYTLSATVDDAAEGKYRIDRATGQITVGPRTVLNREAEVGAFSDGGAKTHAVTVTATDPWNATSGTTDNQVSISVTITVKDVNEAPTVSEGPTKTKQPENMDSTDATPDVDNDDVIVTTYKATDPESTNCSACTWSVSGPDSGLFNIVKTGENADTIARLTFKNAPDFEDPADANEDNVYEVTIEVTDDGVNNRNKMSATRNVMIIVTNDNERGKVTYSSVRPKVGIPFTASLTDPDGETTDVEWEWKRTTEVSVPENCAAETLAFDMDIDEDSDTYTPQSDDLDQCLKAEATYTDPYDFGRTASDPSKTAVIINNDNVAPEFKEGLDKSVMQATRSIEENSPDATASPLKTSDVGGPVVATDPNATYDANGATTDAEGQLTYTLDGRDKDSFEIDRTTGQITVKKGTKLDYEKEKSYMVTVTATDPSQASTTIDVTINVTNEDEAPVIAGEDVIKDYAENGTASVARFTAKDPEGRKVYWSLDGDQTESPDVGDFEISSNGELHFMSAPDFDGAVDSDGDNVYVVRVTASDDAPGADSTVSGDSEAVSGKGSMKKVTVTVTNKDETGTLTITPRYPDTADTLTAALADEDSDSLNPTWKWYLNGSVVEGESTSTYTPPDNATGSVRVEVIYSDGLGSTSKRLAATTTVIQAVSPNPSPEFTDGATTTREVSENRHPATVGAPVRATDTGIHNGKLEYSVPDDDANFTVDLTTGQLRTKLALDYETATTTEGTESVVVTVTDPAGATDTIVVTVRVKDVNEAPTITRGPTMKMLDEDDVDTDVGDEVSKEVGTYTAKDPESTGTGDVCNAASCTWSLRGTDAEDFMIADGTDGTTFGALTFKEFPNYDIPVDSNRDNVYMVTVVLTDKGNTTVTRDVAVMVQDAEENGVVTFSAVQPKVGIPFTASLDDDDGDVTDVTWRWASQALDGAANCPTAAAPEEDGWVNILGAKDATYTPKASDATGDLCLQATATYADRKGPGKTARDVSANDVSVNNDNRGPVFKKNGQEITEDTRYIAEKDRDSSDLVVANSDGKTVSTIDPNTVDPVMATDPNGDDLLTYTLGGPDVSLFKITDDTTDTTRGGQISLKDGTKLNYEDKITYMVMVTATDPDGLNASVDVTIMVVDVDEAPKIIVGGLVVRGTGNINYAEDGMGMVATYSAAGPDAADATWSLSGADAGAFSISSAGVLTFMASPNYEMPMDANTDNIYMVMVNANDGTNDAMKTVTVRVTNEDEPGRVTFWRDGADATTAEIVVGDELGGAVDDSDGNPNDTFPIAMYTRIDAANVTSWQWAKTMTPDMMDSWMPINGATDAAYMVMEGDNGYYLQATAMYDDGEGMGKMASENTMMVTMNASPMFDSETSERMVPENTAAGENVGAPVTAMDADNDTLTYSLSGTDMASFTVDNMGQIMVGAGTMLDYETKDSYEVMVTATDPDSASDMIMVTITVTNEGETGEVTLWAGMDALTMAPQVGETITGAVMDPDGGVMVDSWQWSRTMTPDMMDSWMPISDATGAAYMVMEGDTGYHLRVMATYTDAAGTDMGYSPATMMVGAEAEGTLLDRYDENGNAEIDLDEVFKAIDDYFDYADRLTLEEVYEIVDLYFEG